MSPSVRLVFFASAREIVGAPSLEWDIPAKGCTVATVLSDLTHHHPRLRPVLKGSRLVRNGNYIRGSRVRVAPGDEIAIHPPYSGG